jgi:hypothetical protein
MREETRAMSRDVRAQSRVSAPEAATDRSPSTPRPRSSGETPRLGAGPRRHGPGGGRSASWSGCRVTHPGLDRRHLGPANRGGGPRCRRRSWKRSWRSSARSRAARYLTRIEDASWKRPSSPGKTRSSGSVKSSRPDLLLDLSPIGRPALRVPNRTAPAFDPEQSGKYDRFAATTRRRNRTFQAGDRPALPVLKFPICRAFALDTGS